MSETWVATSEEESVRAARHIARLLPPSGVVHFTGDLGAGKTFLIRAIAAELGAEPDEVSSPTFAIVHEYPLRDGGMLAHLDCYRLSDHPREWEEIGIPDLLAGPGLKLVEWPKAEFARFADVVATVEVTVGDDDARVIRFTQLPAA